MTTAEQLTELFSEIGPQNPEIDGVSQHAESSTWAVGFDDGLVVEASLDEDLGVLAFSANLGQPSSEHQFAVYETLLLFNSLRSTGGVTACLTEPNGDLELNYDLDLRDADAVTLPTVLANFAAKTRIWRAVVETGAVDESFLSNNSSDFSQSIRV